MSKLTDHENAGGGSFQGNNGAPEGLSPREARGLRGGVWAATTSLGSAGLSLVSLVALSRILGPESFGLMAMVEASLALGQLVLQSGLSELLIQIKRLRKEHTDTIFWSLQVIGAGFVLAVIMARDLLERFFVQEGLASLLAATSFVLYLQAAGAVPRALFVRRMRFDVTAQAAISSVAVGAGAGITLALAGYGVWSLVWMRLSTVFVETLILWLKSSWRPHARWSRAHFLELWQFSASRGLTGLMIFVNKEIPRLILGRVAGATALGHFVFARRSIEMAAMMLVSPVRMAAMPAFARLQDDLDEVRTLYRKGTGLTTVIVFPIFLGFALVAPVVVPLAVGSRWLPATPLIQLFALDVLRLPFNVWNGAVLRGLGKPHWHLLSPVARSLVTLPLIFVLLPYGGFGVALAILIGTYLSWPVAMLLVARLIGLSPGVQLLRGAPALLVSAIMAGVLLLVRQPLLSQLAPWAASVALAATGAGVYVAALALVARPELDGLLELIRNIRTVALRRPVSAKREAAK